MKRKIAATLFSALLAGTALADRIETSELPPPAQNEAPDSSKLRSFIEQTLKERHDDQQMHVPNPNDWMAFSSADLWLHGIPEPEDNSIDALAKKQKRYPSYRDVKEPDRSIPTAYDYKFGNWRANVGTNVTTATSTRTFIPELHPEAISPSGGAGALNGRVEYDTSSWQFYGGTKRELVANADGTISVNQNFNGGTYYKLPPSVLGGKVGTGFEVNPFGDAKTRLEYRQTFGNTEGFLAAERTAPFQHSGPDVTGVNGLKAGINRKF